MIEVWIGTHEKVELTASEVIEAMEQYIEREKGGRVTGLMFFGRVTGGSDETDLIHVHRCVGAVRKLTPARTSERDTIVAEKTLTGFGNWRHKLRASESDACPVCGAAPRTPCFGVAP
jgi:hypothetical protein